MGVDLHLHSTASDGSLEPDRIPALAASVGLDTIALTDHDTVAGVSAACIASMECGVAVIAGCEFSVRVPWGELHVLGYFLPVEHSSLLDFLQKQRDEREVRAREIVHRLFNLGIVLKVEDVKRVAGSGSIGRPHIARAMVAAGVVQSVGEAFDRYLADGKPAFVERRLTDLESVTGLVREIGGVTSAAHLKHRANRTNLRTLRDGGIDAVEVTHPSHDRSVVRLLNLEADRLGLLKTGGSDWHGPDDYRHERLGSMDVPKEWLVKLEALHAERAA